MKKILSVLLATCLFVTSLSLFSFGAVQNDYYYDFYEELTTRVKAPQYIGGRKGETFYATVEVDSLSRYLRYGYSGQAIDGVIQLPDGVALVNAHMAPTLYNGKLSYNVDRENKLRLAYMNTDRRSDISMNLGWSGWNYQNEVLYLTLRLEKNIPTGTILPLHVEEFSIKYRSYRVSGLDRAVHNQTTVGYGWSGGGKLTVIARELYTPAKNSIMPADKKAVAVEFYGLNGTPEITFGDTTFYYAPEFYRGGHNYIALVDKSAPLSQLSLARNYTIGDEPAEVIKFGDITQNNVVNAQDALDTLAYTLRILEDPSDKEILAMNVLPDGHIETYDVIAIVDQYSSYSYYKFPIVYK